MAVDAVLLAYMAMVSGIILVRMAAIPHPGALLAAHLALAGMILLTARLSRPLASEKALVVRVAITFAVIPALFLLLGGIVSHANPYHAERALKRIDDFLFFGRNPNLLIDRIANPVLTEYLQIIYATYYFLPLAIFIGLFRDRKWRGIEETLLAVVTCLLFSYLGYFLVPSTGPSVNLHHLYPWPGYEEELLSGESSLPGLALADSLRRLTFQAEALQHDCFPSGHTAMALVVLLMARRHHPTVYRILLIPIVSLIFSTVYLRYHYFIDVVAGVGVAALILKAGPRIERLFEKVLLRAAST